MSPRRSPRFVVRALLQAMKADLALSVSRWTIQSQIRIPAAERDDPMRTQRPRKSWEYPEWRVDDWQILDRELGDLAEQVDDARAYVAEQIRRLHCDAGCGARLPITEARAGFTTCEHCRKQS